MKYAIIIFALAMSVAPAHAGDASSRYQAAVKECAANPDARESGKDDESAISVEECARRIVQSTAASGAPVSCMPNAPYGHAPQWAVDLVKRRGGTIASSPEDPIWQHADCDKKAHTVTWHLPGEDDEGDGD